MPIDFMVIGAQKSGTTSLAAQLANHPQICFSRVKEPGFFSSSADWESGLQEYHQLFEPVNGQLCGEGSTMYTFLPQTPDTSKRIHAYNPDLKLIYIMRQPVDRVISHYNHNLVRGLERRPPEESVIEDSRYISRSRYGVQIRPYIELFGRKNILMLVFEEYIADESATLKEIAGFLGITEDGFQILDAGPQNRSVGVPHLKYESIERFTYSSFFRSIRDYVPEAIRHTVRYRFLSNRLTAAPEFGQELKETIWRFVVSDIKSVEELLGRNLPLWYSGTES